MPSTATVSKSPAKPARKTRARKASTAAKPRSTRTRKAAPKVNPTSATPLPVVITPDAPSVKESYKFGKVELKSLKDYPRDGLALVLLPVLYLEALVKELLPLVGKIKLG